MFHLPVLLPLYLLPLTLDDLGLMDTAALFLLLLDFFFPSPSKPKGEWMSPSLIAVFSPSSPPLHKHSPLPLGENGYYLCSAVPSVLPSSLLYFAKRSAKHKLWGKGGAEMAAQPQPGQNTHPNLLL